MVKISVVQVLVLLVFVDKVTSLINETIADVANDLKVVKTRRQITDKAKRKKSKSTSSSKSRQDGSSNSGDSLDLSTAGISSSEDGENIRNKNMPQSSAERKGWRKWHRKCTPCIEDQVKKWRDPSISWICGGFQRARRSFKSICMMYYRNCQDGTMFTKIHDRRCADDAAGNTHGQHFFYEYKVLLSDESASGSHDASSLQHSEST